MSGEFSPSDVLGPLTDIERRNAPAVLFTAGDVGILEDGPRVSVVGSRHASAHGLGLAAQYTRHLVEHGIPVVSGLAAGVDTVAHRTAIDAGGRTVAVLGTPLNVATPVSNRALQTEIMEFHLAVSQFRKGTPISRTNFPMRNRTMALLTDATLVVVAGDKSGTKHQSWEALRLGRLLLIDERVADNPALSWPSEMIQYGAQVVSPTELPRFLAELPQLASRAPPVL